MTLKQKVINILKIQEKDISVLAKEMNIPEAELLSLLERTDLTPQFIESLSHHLRLSSKDLMKDDSKSIPLGVYDFKYDKQIRKEWFRNSFNSILFPSLCFYSKRNQSKFYHRNYLYLFDGFNNNLISFGLPNLFY